MLKRLENNGWAFILVVVGLSLFNIIFVLLSQKWAAVTCSLLVLAVLLFMILFNNRLKLLCRGRTGCGFIADEREDAIVSLKAHLSEQRHDVFNLLQLIYGFTQLKKPEKVLALIRDYCSNMENIGRLYNAKCIKLADLLYTKEKEAGIIDLNMDFLIDIEFEPDIVMLEHESYLYAVNGILSNFFLWMHSQSIQGGLLSCHMKEYPDAYRLTVFIKEKQQDGGKGDVEAFKLIGEAFYWRKISREVPAAQEIAARCRDASIGLEIDERNAKVTLEMRRNR